MATFKVFFRRTNQKGMGSLSYLIKHKRNKVVVRTNMTIFNCEWNEDEQSIRSNRLETELYSKRIKSELMTLKHIDELLDCRETDYCASDIANRFKVEYGEIGFLSFMMYLIDDLKQSYHFGTANNYLRTLKSFSAFLDGYNIGFKLLTSSLIIEYSRYLESRGLLRNSISFYMRNLRAVYNKAVKQGVINYSTNPFQDVYTGVDKTVKRAVQNTVISKLYRADFTASPHLQLAKDIFLFSFFTRGMAFVDIAFLKKSSIQNGVIYYKRRKTNQLLSIRLERGMIDIIKRYSNNNSQYIFPFLNSDNKDLSYKQYQLAINRINVNLKRISDILELGTPLTSYVARHSWATIAHNNNIPISVISAALGHTSEQTTQIYLASIDNSKIDEANSRIISLVDM